VIAAIIIFAPEIRKFLLIVGRSSIFSDGNVLKEILFFWRKKENSSFNISPIIDASKNLAGSNTGALMVISNNTELKFYAESGDILDAELSKRLLISIFNKYSPLHDGAVIVFNGRIKAARCILPVTEREVPAIRATSPCRDRNVRSDRCTDPGRIGRDGPDLHDEKREGASQPFLPRDPGNHQRLPQQRRLG